MIPVRVAVATAIGLLGVSAAAQPSFTALGDLPGGTYRSHAMEVSGDGTTVVGWSSTSVATQEAFRWTEGTGLVSLGYFPSSQPHSVAAAASYDGSVIVGGSSVNSTTYAFRWTSSGGMVTVPDGPLPILGMASDVSGDGAVVCGNRNGGVFRWSQVTGAQNLPSPSGWQNAPIAVPVGMSSNGSVITMQGFTDGGQFALLRWTLASGTILMDGGPSVANDFVGGKPTVSGDGAVGFGSLGSFAHRWTSVGRMQPLGYVATMYPGRHKVWAASDDGRVVVGEVEWPAEPYNRVAFIWTPDAGMRSLQDVLVNEKGLDLTGWVLTDATGVSSDGRTIVGNGINPFGAQEAAWKATLGPAPCPADYNDDGFVDGIDYDQFNNDFEAGC